MKASVFPGDTMVLSGQVKQVITDDVGCAWVDLHLAVSVDNEVATGCTARVALPKDKYDNPWTRKGDQWKP
jgi:hypothetical protein